MGLALELSATPTEMIYPRLSGIDFLLGLSMVCYFRKILTTDILFLVRVPVLSEQMLSAPPMVSHAYK